MKRQLNLKSPEQLLGILLILLSVIYIIGIFSTLPNGDEGLQAEHIYFLKELGYVKSDIWAGYDFGWEDHQYHYHKGTVLIGFAAVKLFGFSLASLRLTSVLFYLFFVMLFYKYIKSSGIPKAELLFKLSLLAILLNTIFLEFFFIFRPEAGMMAFGFASFYFIDRGIKEDKYKFIILGGIFAGFSALMHLIGLTMMVAGGLTLLFRKRIKFAFVFSFFSVLALGIYFYDLLSKEAFDGFMFQFFNEASLAEKQQSPFGKVLDEHIRFFNSEKESTFTVIFLLGLIANFKYLRRKFGNILIFGLSSMVVMTFLTPNTTTKYSLIYYPFMAFVIGIGIFRIREYKMGYRYVLLFFLVAYAVIHPFRSTQRLCNHVNIEKRNAEIAEQLSVKDVNVFAVESFVFNEIENFTIHGWLAFFRYFTKRHPDYKPNMDDFLAFCDKLDDRYLIFDRKYFGTYIFEHVPQSIIEKGRKLQNYEVIISNEELLILENIRLREK